jgi:hypothetical protein
MIQNNSSNRETLKQIRLREAKEKEVLLLEKCNAFANEKYGEEEMKKMSVANKGLWFLPVVNDDESIEKLGIMKPINRHILSHASTKIEDEGLYVFLEACMRECWVIGDEEILDEDEYFIPAAMKFNKIMESKKVAFIKR